MLYDPKWQLNPIGKTLIAAADYIEEHGWCQGQVRDSFGRVCITGALGYSHLDSDLGPLHLDSEVREAAYMLLNKEVGIYIAAWNDAPGRTQDEVVTKLREVAALASAQRRES